MAKRFTQNKLIMNDEISESAKAVQEVAKTTRIGIEATQQLGGFVARVINEPIEAVTGMLSDKLRFMRWERQLRLRDRVIEKMKERGLEEQFNTRQLKPVPPKLALPIVESASLEEDDELQDVWANLLTSAIRPEFKGVIRSAYIDIIKQLEVIDVHVLNFIHKTYLEERKARIRRYSHSIEPYLKNHHPKSIDIPIAKFDVMAKLKIKEEPYMDAIDNLIRLRLIAPYVEEDSIETEIDGEYDSKDFTYFHNYDNVCMTRFGISFIEACVDPPKNAESQMCRDESKKAKSPRLVQ
jgi:hypothetical protein